MFRALQYRLRDSTWTIVFKSLITVHLMIREGSPDVTLAYLSKHKNMLAVSVFSDGQYWTRLPRPHQQLIPVLQRKSRVETSATTQTTCPNEHVRTGKPRSTGCGTKNRG